MRRDVDKTELNKGYRRGFILLFLLVLCVFDIFYNNKLFKVLCSHSYIFHLNSLSDSFKKKHSFPV